jgi:transcriptional regulator with XRE-family HTH domain
MHPLKSFRQNHVPPLSQAGLGVILGVGRVTVNRWETGYRHVGIQFLPEITRKTGIPARELRPDLVELVGVEA